MRTICQRLALLVLLILVAGCGAASDPAKRSAVAPNADPGKSVARKTTID